MFKESYNFLQRTIHIILIYIGSIHWLYYFCLILHCWTAEINHTASPLCIWYPNYDVLLEWSSLKNRNQVQDSVWHVLPSSGNSGMYLSIRHKKNQDSIEGLGLEDQYLVTFTPESPTMRRTNQIPTWNGSVVLTSLLIIQPNKERHTYLSLAHVNAWSIRNKIGSFQHYLQDEKIDICTVTETWLKPDDIIHPKDITSPGYDILSQPRTDGRQGGVWPLFIIHQWKYTTLHRLNNQQDWEYMNVHVKFRNKTLNLEVQQNEKSASK